MIRFPKAGPRGYNKTLNSVREFVATSVGTRDFEIGLFDLKHNNTSSFRQAATTNDQQVVMAVCGRVPHVALLHLDGHRLWPEGSLCYALASWRRIYYRKEPLSNSLWQIGSVCRLQKQVEFPPSTSFLDLDNIEIAGNVPGSLADATILYS